eukprot:13010221-Heterocapsa_arctica.AAC.1
MPTSPVALTPSVLPPNTILPYAALIRASPSPGLANDKGAYRIQHPRPKWSRPIFCCGTAAYP